MTLLYTDIGAALPISSATVVLPTAPKALRPNEVDTSRVPTAPPFKVYAGNVPYDCNEFQLKEFFHGLSIKDVQIPRNESKGRGFAYIEFHDRESLIEALKLNGESLNTRAVKINLPDESGREDRRMGGFGARDEDDRTTGDWRSGPRSSQQPTQRSHGGYDFRSSDRQSEPQGPSLSDQSTAWRSDSRPANHAPNQASYQRDQGFGRNGYSQETSRGGYHQDYSQQSGGYGQFQTRSSYNDRQGPNRGYSDNASGYEGRGHYDQQSSGHRDQQGDRHGGYREDRYQTEDNFSRADFGKNVDFNRPPRTTQPDLERPSQRQYNHPSTTPSDSSHVTHAPVVPAEPERPKERPRLQLQPRTKPLDEVASPANLSKNIFGEAKPVDTLKKELEVEEKLSRMEVKSESSPTQVASDSDANRIRKSSTSSSSNRSRKESETSDRRFDTNRQPPQVLQRPQEGSRDFDRQRSHNNDFTRRDNRDGPRNFDNRGQRNFDRRDDRRADQGRPNDQQPRRGGYNHFNRTGRDDRRRPDHDRHPDQEHRRIERPPRFERKDKQIDAQNGGAKPDHVSYS